MQISANGIGIEVEDEGPAAGEPLLLIMGLGMQLVAWPDGLVRQLVASGFRVIRFDNRDMGLSQRFDHLGVPNIALDAIRHSFGMGVTSGYALADMADDAAGVLAALGLQSAHVFGVSMGGMIAQHLAARRPERVRSLTLMMTSSGARHLPGPSLKVRMALLGRPAKARHPGDLSALIDYYVRLYRLIGSPGYPIADALIAERVEGWLRRFNNPASNLRQLAAIAADGDRSALLPRLTMPVQVIHGRDDALVPLAAGLDLARKIPRTRLDVIDGMGHDLPETLWPRFAAAIKSLASA